MTNATSIARIKLIYMSPVYIYIFKVYRYTCTTIIHTGDNLNGSFYFPFRRIPSLMGDILTGKNLLSLSDSKFFPIRVSIPCRKRDKYMYFQSEVISLGCLPAHLKWKI